MQKYEKYSGADVEIAFIMLNKCFIKVQSHSFCSMRNGPKRKTYPRLQHGYTDTNPIN